MISGKMIPCQSREAVVTVMSYRNGVMDGYLQHPRLREREKLYSLSQMILLLEGLMDLEDCPDRPLPFIPPMTDSPAGADTFRIQILFREHYTWQGKLVWQNENTEAVFHSGLELIQLFDEVLSE